MNTPSTILQRVMLIITIIGVALTAISTQASAALIIDDFSTDQAVGVLIVNGPGILGGDRDVVTADADFVAAGGVGTVTENGGSGGGDLRYDGTNTTIAQEFDLGSVDLLAAGNAFTIDVTAVTGPVGVRITVFEDFSTFSRNPVLADVSSPGLFTIPFSLLTDVGVGGGADFSSVESVFFSFGVNSGESISLNSIAVVPVPSAMLLMGSGLFGLVGWRWWTARN